MCRSRIPKKAHGHLMLPWAFPDKVMPDIDFTDEAVVECDAQVAKKFF